MHEPQEVMGRDAPNPSGTNEPQTTAEEIMEIMEPGEPYSASEIGESFDLAHGTIHHRLNKMAEDGLIEKKKLGHRTVVWMLTEDSDQ